jgi:hypothetical protein
MTRGARRALRSVATAALAFAALQALLIGTAQRRPGLRDRTYAHKRALMADHLRARADAVGARPRTVWAVGSSRLEFGLDALGTEAALDRAGAPPTAVFNFGVAGNGPVLTLIYLQRLLADSPPPEWLLLEVTPYLMRDDSPPLDQNYTNPGRLTPAERSEVVGTYGFDPNRYPPDGLARFTPAYEMRGPLLRRLLPGWQPPPPDDPDCGFRLANLDPGGWLPYPGEPGPAVRQARTEQLLGTIRDFSASYSPGGPGWGALCESILVARRRHVPVTLLLMPEGGAFRAWYTPASLRKLDRLLADLHKGFGVDIVDARAWAGDDAFIDGHHLLQPGARAFTDRLAREVVLPRLRPAPPSPPSPDRPGPAAGADRLTPRAGGRP